MEERTEVPASPLDAPHELGDVEHPEVRVSTSIARRALHGLGAGWEVSPR